MDTRDVVKASVRDPITGNVRQYDIPGIWVEGMKHQGYTLTEAVNHWHEQSLMVEEMEEMEERGE